MIHSDKIDTLVCSYCCTQVPVPTTSLFFLSSFMHISICLYYLFSVLPYLIINLCKYQYLHLLPYLRHFAVGAVLLVLLISVEVGSFLMFGSWCQFPQYVCSAGCQATRAAVGELRIYRVTSTQVIRFHRCPQFSWHL